MKKKLFLVLLMLFSVFAFAQEEEAGEAAEENHGFLYIISEDEMQYFIESWNWLQAWESGEVKVSDSDFAKLYENQIGQDYFSSMLFENFFRNTKDEKIKKQLKKYIKKNKLEDKPYEKALLKKIDSKENKTVQNLSETQQKEVVNYIYNNTEYDENINLFNFAEVHPFDDEYGVILFDNDWNVLTWNSMETDEPVSDKKFILMGGGDTNAMTITFEEYDNIKSLEDLKKQANTAYYERDYGETWQLIDLPKEGILERCGADNVLLGFGSGDDYFPEIKRGVAVSLLYNKALKKGYKMEIFTNFSTININYENRSRILNYLYFFPMFAYCE